MSLCQVNCTMCNAYRMTDLFLQDSKFEKNLNKKNKIKAFIIINLNLASKLLTCFLIHPTFELLCLGPHSFPASLKNSGTVKKL